MHWCDEVALQLIKKNPDKDSFVLAAGISPSGVVHIGNFRDVATIYLVSRGLQREGKKTKLLFSWDDYDRFRKVPKTIPEDRIREYEGYIGRPCSEVPDPYGCHESYAQHYEKEFEDSLRKIGLEFDIIRYQSEEYKSGRYKEGIITALKKRKELYDIQQDFKTQEHSNEEKENYYPIAIYCSKCGKDNTKVISISDDCTIVDYECTCGNMAKLNLSNDNNFKLPWKVDWPMRWKYEEVDFEPGGKDHASPQGSYQVSRIISKKVYEYNEPMFQGYEFIGIKGLTGKMSSSSGLSINLDELLKIYPPEMIWWLYARKAPNEAFDINLGNDVPRIYNEFDKLYNNYYNDKDSIDENIKRVLDIILENSNKKIQPPFNILATLYSISNEKIELIEEMFTKIGMTFTVDDLSDRLGKVSYWLKEYSPGMIVKLRNTPDFEHYSNLDEDVKKWINDFCNLMKVELTPDELTTRLYAIPKDESLEKKENKNRQLRFFKAMYKLLIGQDRGPMLSTLILALGAKNVLPIVEPLISDKRD